jgi:multidrug transporter EmrE-like cation transporter
MPCGPVSVRRADWGIAMEGEPAGLLRIGCVMLILGGVAGLKLTG